MKFIPRISLLAVMFFFISVSSAQELVSAWQAYLKTNNRITQLQEKQHILLAEQQQVNQEIGQLKKSAAWYNAWLNKWLLSGYTNRQLQLTDSLQVIGTDLNRLNITLAREQLLLMQAYESILASVDDAGMLSAQDQETTLRVGRWLSALPDNEVSLPDYHYLVGEHYPNQDIRHLVLADLQILLVKKIAQLDSLLVERNRADQLANRLAAFHEDLGLQMEVEQDVQTRDQDGQPQALSAWGGAPGFADAMDDRYDSESTVQVGTELTTNGDAVTLSGRRSTLEAGSANTMTSTNPNYLESKRNEYLKLLAEIEVELRPAQ